MEKQDENQEELLMDFSTMFKGKKAARKPTLKPKQAQTSKSPNWLLQIPAKLDITREQVQERRYMDEARWMSVAKTLTPSFKILAAVVSAWNYLHSEKGNGTDKFLSCKKALEVLQEAKPGFLSTSVAQHQRVNLIREIIQILGQKTGKAVKSETVVKMAEPSPVSTSKEQQKENLLRQLTDKNSAFIYLAFEDIFCPIGFEYTPFKPLDAFMPLQKIENDHELWIINSCLGRGEPSFCIKRWEHIEQDLSCQWPEYLDIKNAKQGVQIRNTEENQGLKGNGNCILRLSK